MNLDPSVLALLNRQINAEQYAYQLYTVIATWADGQAFPGLQTWATAQASDEDLCVLIAACAHRHDDELVAAHPGDRVALAHDRLEAHIDPSRDVCTSLIVDRVLDRFPNLKFGVIEQGASWVPGWMRNMDSAHNAFYKNEERLQKMSLKPSEFVKRQVRITPYPHEDAGWISANSSDEVCLFSSDYPHVEGGRNPIKRFEVSMPISGAASKRFFAGADPSRAGNVEAMPRG